MIELLGGVWELCRELVALSIANIWIAVLLMIVISVGITEATRSDHDG